MENVKANFNWREILYDILLPTLVAFLIVIVGMLPPRKKPVGDESAED